MEQTMEKRKRTCRLGVYFTESELEALRKKAAAARLSMGEFIRKSVADKEIKPAPPADIPRLTREIHRVGNNLNQLLRNFNSGNPMDLPLMRTVLEQTRQAADAVVKAYTMED